MEKSANAYTEIELNGKPEDVASCVEWLGDVYSGDLRFSKDALVAIGMEERDFIPLWSGVEPIGGGTKIWITNVVGVSELNIVNLHGYVFDRNNVTAVFRCLRASYESLGEYDLDGEELHSYSVSSEIEGRERFEVVAKEMFGEHWPELGDDDYCEKRLRDEEKRYEES
jgi:hypothetical protein